MQGCATTTQSISQRVNLPVEPATNMFLTCCCCQIAAAAAAGVVRPSLPSAALLKPSTTKQQPLEIASPTKLARWALQHMALTAALTWLD
jgi:hypothetical protein